MVTDAGTEAAGLLAVSPIVKFVATARLRATVPAAEVPPTTEAGLTETVTPAMASVALWVWPPDVAVMMTLVLPDTAALAMGKVALVAPAGTTTLDVMSAAALLLESVTTVSDVTDAASVTVPVEAAPSATTAGLTATAERLADPAVSTVSDAVLVTVP
jgi:hypothetical protein